MIILDAKTDYSFMRGFGTPKQWLERCKETGVTAFGIADYCSTWGHTFFRKEFKGSGVKLLYGVQIPVVTNLDKDPRHSLVTLIAREDLKPLYDLVTLAQKQSYYRPRLTWKQLEKFEGWIVLDYLLPHHVKHPLKLKRCFVGVAPATPKHMLDMKMPRVLAYSPRYPSPDLRQGYQLFQAISEGQRFGEVDVEGVHLLRASEQDAYYKELKITADDLDNVARIATETCADIPPGTLIVPEVYADKAAELRKQAMAGAKAFKHVWSGKKLKPEYAARLDRELGVIREKDFEDYFFFVNDIVRFAKGRMFVGPGRGSAGGSLLCYFLGITTVDPLKFGTMFERFLDITRNDWPDIDVDFPDTRREEVFEYLKAKYGEDRVARLGTISEFGGKSAINDTAKATGVPQDVAREFGKYTEGVGQGIVISPQRIFGTGPQDTMLTDEHYKLVEKYPQIKLAGLIDSHARHHGVHAAGVVVTQGAVTQYGALNDTGTLSMDMKAAEAIGLVKMDALGLRTLSVIQTACDLAGIDPKSLYDLTWDDQTVFDAVFNCDRVTGIFQFEGHAVRSLLKGLGKIETFDDICALTSLARPGPLIGGAAEGWVKARKGEIAPRQLHPSLESTYGVICYQEQMMKIVRDLAGFDEPSVNGMRRAVGKKDPEKLRSYRTMFVEGATKHFASLPYYKDNDEHESAAEAAEALWDELCEFGSYAFNLSHAVEYSMISYMTAWLKTYHPLQFAAACLRYAADDEQGKNLLRELKEEGFSYVPFDPEKSKATWSIIDGKLYGGFDSVRGIGEKTALNLVAKRNNSPKKWLDELTPSMRDKLLAPRNTPWHTLTYFSETYAELYANPKEFKRSYCPAGFKPPVIRIKDIPDQKGNYAFVGRILRVQKRDMNDESRLAKREGKKVDTNTYFINVFVEDDTGEIGCTINRFKADSFQWLLDGDTSDRDFFFRGNIIGEGRRWVFLDNVVELVHDNDVPDKAKS